jgi:hypothetical protein
MIDIRVRFLAWKIKYQDSILKLKEQIKKKINTFFYPQQQ